MSDEVIEAVIIIIVRKHFYENLWLLQQEWNELVLHGEQLVDQNKVNVANMNMFCRPKVNFGRQFKNHSSGPSIHH